MASCQPDERFWNIWTNLAASEYTDLTDET